MDNASTRCGLILSRILEGLNIPIKYRPGPNYKVTLPHVTYDVTNIHSPGADNKKWLHFWSFNIIYETTTLEDEGFRRLLEAPETRYISAMQMPGYVRYTFQIKNL